MSSQVLNSTNHNHVESGTILIVDDTPYNLGVILDYLGDSGFEVLLAEDGETMFEQIEYALPDIILLDVMMPGIDGFETCRRLKANERTKDIPVIFMTSLTEIKDKIQAFSVGGIDYVTKPLQHEEVLARVTTHLKLRNLQKQLQKQNELLQQEIQERYQREQEIKRLNDDLQHRTAQLEIANQELEAFSYSVSHDLNNPLSIIIGFVYNLRETEVLKQYQDVQHCLSRINVAARRMEQLIQDLMHLAKVTQAEMLIESVDLSKIARDIVDSIQLSSPERNVNFMIADHIIAQGDGRLLRVLLENLLGNAWKYTAKTPQACIEFGVCDPDSNTPVYFVRDNGVGFDMSKADKLFHPFIRLHKRKEFEGTGIGLATVQRIIHRHGGRIWAEAKVEQGATFNFTLNKSF